MTHWAVNYYVFGLVWRTQNTHCRKSQCFWFIISHCRYLHLHLFAPTLICTYTYLHLHLFAPTLICAYTYLHLHLFAPTYLRLHLFAPTLICAYTYLHLHLFAPTLIYAYTYLHISQFHLYHSANIWSNWLKEQFCNLSFYTCIQGVPGGMFQTTRGCSLC
jgi:hypothetical protein